MKAEQDQADADEEHESSEEEQEAVGEDQATEDDEAAAADDPIGGAPSQSVSGSGQHQRRSRSSHMVKPPPARTDEATRIPISPVGDT